MLEIKALWLSFGGLTALADVSLDVASGQVCGLIGPNGSGKTTLLNVVSGLYPPDAGAILLAGRPLAGLAPHRIQRCGVARTFQTPRVFARLTVAENLQAAGLVAGRRGARRPGPRLADFGLAEWAETLAASLPLAAQRRLELARALVPDPALLLLDEPAGGMTPGETDEMMQLIRERAAPGRACLVVEHKMDMIAELCQSVCVLNFGRKIAEGAPAAVLEQAAVIEAYLGVEQVA